MPMLERLPEYRRLPSGHVKKIGNDAFLAVDRYLIDSGGHKARVLEGSKLDQVVCVGNRFASRRVTLPVPGLVPSPQSVVQMLSAMQDQCDVKLFS
jgi:hypothetical protein